jgi:hypothetical protein
MKDLRPDQQLMFSLDGENGYRVKGADKRAYVQPRKSWMAKLLEYGERTEPVYVAPPSPLPPARLLILGCSATKKRDPGYMPAIERYDGPLWRDLRAHDREGKYAQVAFLSAAHGFQPANAAIPDYDAKLTKEAAEDMILLGIGERWPRPNGKQRGGTSAAGEIGWFTRGESRPIEDVALVGGHLYVAVMQAWLEEFMAAGHVLPTARVTVINDSIGLMRRQMRNWLLDPQAIS